MKQNFFKGILCLTVLFFTVNVYSAKRVETLEEELAGFRSTAQAFVKKSKTKQQKECFKNALFPVIESKAFQKKLSQCIEYEKKNAGLTKKWAECSNLRFDFINKAMKKCK